MRISDWSSDVCPSDLEFGRERIADRAAGGQSDHVAAVEHRQRDGIADVGELAFPEQQHELAHVQQAPLHARVPGWIVGDGDVAGALVERLEQLVVVQSLHVEGDRSEEHTSELQSLMRTTYAVFCLTKKPFV